MFNSQRSINIDIWTRIQLGCVILIPEEMDAALAEVMERKKKSGMIKEVGVGCPESISGNEEAAFAGNVTIRPGLINGRG